MIYKEIPIQVQGSSKEARAQFYILETPTDKLKLRKRPVIIICPGGGYHTRSFREGEPMAGHFLGRGYHACVLQYSVAPAIFPTSIMELGTVFCILKEHEEEWHIDMDNIVVQGSSAGGHLAASYGAFWNREFLASGLGVDSKVLKPKGVMLSYPVITSDPEYAHMPSIENLLGEQFEKRKQEMSLEKQVTESMPPCFIWHTAEDGTVPMPNSLLMAMSLWKAGVPVELHVFPEGPHGLSLATPITERIDGHGVEDTCAGWIDLADAWFDRLINKYKENSDE